MLAVQGTCEQRFEYPRLTQSPLTLSEQPGVSGAVWQGEILKPPSERVVKGLADSGAQAPGGGSVATCQAAGRRSSGLPRREALGRRAAMAQHRQPTNGVRTRGSGACALPPSHPLTLSAASGTSGK